MAKPGNDAQTNAPGVSLRPYDPRDEDAAVALWLRTWQAAYPAIDFAARLGWWRER
jgi:putative acetyltransferase